MARASLNEDYIAPTQKATPEQIAASVATEANLAKMNSQYNDAINKPSSYSDPANAGFYYGTAKAEADAAREAINTANTASNESGAKPKTIIDTKDNGDGTYTVFYSDTTSEVKGTKTVDKGNTGVDTSAADLLKQQQQSERVSAFNILKTEFSKYGLGSLVDRLKQYMTDGTPASEFSLKLQETPEYQKRFAANADRIKAGLSALTPAEYIGMEDQYQNLMRNYGLPASYYAKDDIGTQAGFQKLLASDVSAAELEDRISTAQKRVINANPEVSAALKQFYPDITNGDILAYTLDPQNALVNIKRKVTAAEIGGAALQSGLSANLARAEELGKYGIDKAAATSGYSTIGAGLQRGSQLAAIYKEDPYTQTTAEQEIFNIPGAQEARKARQKITGLEKATFGGQTGITSGALARDRAGAY
jgi:hypothetical protein